MVYSSFILACFLPPDLEVDAVVPHDDGPDLEVDVAQVGRVVRVPEGQVLLAELPQGVHLKQHRLGAPFRNGRDNDGKHNGNVVSAWVWGRGDVGARGRGSAGASGS